MYIQKLFTEGIRHSRFKETEIGQIGKCIMPKEGVFARVIQGGLAKAGDAIRVLEAER